MMNKFHRLPAGSSQNHWFSAHCCLPPDSSSLLNPWETQWEVFHWERVSFTLNSHSLTWFITWRTALMSLCPVTIRLCIQSATKTSGGVFTVCQKSQWFACQPVRTYLWIQFLLSRYAMPAAASTEKRISCFVFSSSFFFLRYDRKSPPVKGSSC